MNLERAIKEIRDHFLRYSDEKLAKRYSRYFKEGCDHYGISKEIFNQMLLFIEPVMLDGERPVQQGLGWFLRESWRKHPEEVEAFLLKWKETAPRVISSGCNREDA